MKIKKRNTSGNAKNFITRTQAVKKLQVSLADFRRLCIFKGIYPREPRNKKKANKGSTAPVTFYYSKDIQYLMHEPILAKFREHKTFSKKLTKALGKGQVGDAKKLESNRPKYELDHVIKERYPSFMDAVRDLDDGLNMLFLFSNMPVTNKVNAKVVKQAETLCNQWMAYVAKQRVLKKVFVSIKGVYYSANIKGQEVIWLVPFKFPHAIPSDIDFRIMLTFLEFYSTLLHFVLYRLYVDANLVYPPAINAQKLKGVGGISAYVLENKEGESLLPNTKKAETDAEETKISSQDMEKALKADQDAQEESENEAEEENVETVELDEFTDSNKNAGDILQQPSKFDHPSSTLFEGFVFFVGREVPLDILEFLIVSCGGKIVAEASLDELLLNNSSMSLDDLDFSNVTHQISDRAKVLNKVQGRTYVQPQWVFDCINKQTLVNVSDYAPGETLPPHLSPWGDAGSYNPDEAVEENDEEEEVIEGEVEPDQEESDEEDQRTQRELELESAGVEFTEAEKQSLTKGQKKKRSAKDVENEEKDLKKIMMTNKQRKLHKKMQYGIDKQEARTEQLKEKKRKLQKAKQSAK